MELGKLHTETHIHVYIYSYQLSNQFYTTITVRTLKWYKVMSTYNQVVDGQKQYASSVISTANQCTIPTNQNIDYYGNFQSIFERVFSNSTFQIPVEPNAIVTQQYLPVLQVLVQYVLSTYILLVYQSLTLRGLFPAVSLIPVSLSEGHTFFIVWLSEISLIP